MVVLLPVPDLVEEIRRLWFFALFFVVVEFLVLTLNRHAGGQTLELPDGIYNDCAGKQTGVLFGSTIEGRIFVAHVYPNKRDDFGEHGKGRVGRLVQMPAQLQHTRHE